jgi:hypothetical protein
MKLRHLPTLCAALLALCPTLATAQTSAVPSFISYQGRVVDASGANVGAGTPVNRTVIFRIWDNPSSTNEANLIYSEAQTVTVSEGEFSVLVGQGVANPTQTYGYNETAKKLADLGSAFGGSTRYLGVTVASAATIATTDNEITPRQQIVSTAFAMRAKYAEQVGSNGITALTALNSGNIGIGNTNPPARFTVTGANTSTSSSNPQLIITDSDPNERLRIGVDSTGNGTGFIQAFKEGTGAGTGVQNLLLNPNGGSVGIGGPANSTIALAVTGSITATTSIGIGTTTPNFPLSMSNTLGDKIALYGASGAHFGFGIQNNQFQIHTDTNAADVVFGYGTSAAMTETMRIKGNGNVGIGIASPVAKLDVNGNAYVRGQINLDGSIGMGNGLAIWGTNSAGVAEQAFWPRSSDGTYLNYGTNGLFLRNNASTTTMFMGNNGNIGIGTTAPSTRLTLEDGVNTGFYASMTISRPLNSHTGSHMAFIRSGAQAMGVGYAPSLNTFGFGAGASGIAFSPSYLSIDQNTAQVKIGTPTTSPGLLNVASFASSATWTGSLGDGASNVNGSGAQSVSINADAAIVAAVFLATSDRRIKTKLSLTDSVKDLKTLMGIEVTDYQLKDTMTNGSAWHKKVIAQQVEEVYPQAVSRQKGVVPDIYQKASVKEGWVQLATDLKVGERVRLMLPSGDSVEDVLEVRSDSFRTSLKTPADELFVYGREVSDFRNVDYTAISMLNVSATQQLKHEKDAEMQVLRDENAALRRELAAKDKSMEARLIALERRMSGESAAKTVSIKTVSLKTVKDAE